MAGPEDPDTLNAMFHWAELRADQGQLAEAERLYRELLKLRRKAAPDRLGEIGATLAGLGSVLTQAGEPKEGEKLLREALELHRKAPPVGTWAWVTAENESLLGGCLAAQGRYAAAEPLLLQSYGALKDKPAAPPLRKLQALERIVKLYEGWGKPEKAAEWRKKLPAAPNAKDPSPAKK